MRLETLDLSDSGLKSHISSLSLLSLRHKSTLCYAETSMSDDVTKTLIGSEKPASVPEEVQKQTAQPLAGQVQGDHSEFMKQLFELIDTGVINTKDPSTLLKKEVYNELNDEWKDKVDLALINMAQQIERIDEYRKQDAQDAVHLQVMVDHLWQMKERIEEHQDAFVF